MAGIIYAAGTLWDGKGGAVVPPDKSSGWIIPDHLRLRWGLRLGKSEDLLHPLLEEAGTVDYFINDSEHSYECRMSEYTVAYPYLRAGGLLISDDILWNSAFFEFAKSRDLRAGHIGGSMGIIVKPC